MRDAGIVNTESARYWITPVKDYPVESAEECIRNLVGREHIYAFGEGITAREQVQPGDWICFYATRRGVVAYARVASLPRREEHPAIIHPGHYPWVFDVDSENLFLGNPTIIDEHLRARMDAYADKGQHDNWGWLVLTTREISEHDFRLLTRQEGTT
ncbi:MAG: hypothetical protein WCD51_07525 [Anaerolineae bacterium]